MQGVYVGRAICSVLPKGERYPENPLHIFSDDQMETSGEVAQKRQKELAKKNEDLITAQIIQVRSFFKPNK